MPIDPTFGFPNLFATNPALAQMIDGAANRLTTKSGGGATATATATATAGGATATATATAGAGAPAPGSVAFFAQQALDAAMGRNQGGLGNVPGGAIGSFTTGLVEGLATGLTTSFAPGEPDPSSNFPTSGVSSSSPVVQPSMLSVDSQGKITTAGGYTIEATSQFEWKITGPDGSSTRVWGDPHVQTTGKTGGENFDFKKDTTFVLPDGTKINVKCTPWQGNKDVTVTQSLEVIQGNDRVQVNDIDKGKGKAGQVSHGGAGAKETFRTEQTFVAGRNVADWYINGSEIKSNAGAPDLFNVGDTILPEVMRAQMNGFVNSPISEAAWLVGSLASQGNGWGMNTSPSSAQLSQVLQKHGQLVQNGQMKEVMQQVLALLPKLISVLQSLIQLRSYNPYNPQPQPKPVDPPKAQPPVYDPNAHASGLREAFQALGAMLVAAGQFMQMASGLKPSALPVQGR